MFFFDPIYFLIALPPMLLGLWAQWRVKSAFGRYSKVSSAPGITGAQAARHILDANQLRSVGVERVSGVLTDHYDPGGKVLRLSPDVYQSPSLAAVGVAAHEVGHTLQDQAHYAPLKLRSAMVPAVKVGSWLGPMIFMIGLFTTQFFGETVAWLGLILFGMTAVFALVTLPVEFDATKRAKKLLVSEGILAPQELEGVNKVLDAAAWTYVAAALQALLTMLYYASILMRRD